MTPSASIQARPAAVSYIDSPRELRALCESLADVERFALDTEFVGERSYLPSLELIQVGVEDRQAVIDCRAAGELTPLLELITAVAPEKVLHAGQQDIELLARLAGKLPQSIFDTQVAAAMAGYGSQPGYAQLVDRLLHVSIEKSETLTDWSQRPLKAAQISYAADDVRYLLPLYERLRERLHRLERWEWLHEELRMREQRAHTEPVDPDCAYLRVRGRGSLRSRGLVVLRALAAWREELARELDKPRGSIVRDDILVELARKGPTNMDALRSLRGVHSRISGRYGEDIVERARRALDLPREQWPSVPRARGPAAPTGLIELMQAVLRVRAEHAHIAPALLATSADLQELVQRHASGDDDGLAIVQGWRRVIVGEDLLALLDGRAAVAVDPDGPVLCINRE